jgi:hypothetical protein
MDERIRLTIDDTATISRIRWRIASSGPWPAENTLESPLECIVIQRPPLTDIEIEVTWAQRRRRLRGSPPLREHWHPGARDARGARTSLYVLPACAAS